MKFTLEKINKNLLRLALVSLIYRKGAFFDSLIPKPFEVILVILSVITTVYLIRENKIKDFFLSVPKKILIAFGCLLFSILFGWGVGAAFNGIHSNFNTILEFGTFAIGVTTFFLIIFYAKNDQTYAKWYFYALLIPNVYMVCYFLTHGITGYFGMPNDHFLDSTLNQNVLSKILLIAALFFICKSLFELKTKKWFVLLGYVFASSIFVALIFWTVSRGSILSLFLGAALVWLVFSVKQFTLKKSLLAGITVACILSLGFLMVPHSSKHAVSTKISNTNLKISGAANSPVVVDNKAVITSTSSIAKIDEKPQSDKPYEPRLVVLPFFFKYMLSHPFGIGPNTHVDFNIFDINGEPLDPGPNSTYLQILLWGGPLGLASFLYILYFAFNSLRLKLRNSFDSDSLALLGILFALAVSLAFDASLSFFWFWIILALSFI